MTGDHMTYPPAHHLLRDLAFATDASDPTALSTTLAITPGLCDDRGIRLGVLATLVDVGGAGIALRSIAPDWIATADLQTHVIRPVTDGAITLVCRPLRIGARRVVIDAELRDAHGPVCGTGRMAFARIPGSATKASLTEVTEPRPASRTMAGGSPIVEPIVDQCGMTTVGPGQIRFEKSPYIENSFGTVNGGVLALAAEAAAVSAAGGGHAQDLHIHYLEQIGDGPVGVTAEVVRHGADAHLCRVSIEDLAPTTDGGRRLVAVADITVLC